MHTKLMLTNISLCISNPCILIAHIINNSDTEQIYKLIKKSNSDNQIIQIQTIFSELLSKIFNTTNLPSIVSYAYCEWSNGFHIKYSPIQTNFWNKHNIILAGEWVSPITNSFEGSCISAIKTFKIISDPLYFDKLTHKPDNVNNIEGNKYELT
jgi:hypothetical protein